MSARSAGLFDFSESSYEAEEYSLPDRALKFIFQMTYEAGRIRLMLLILAFIVIWLALASLNNPWVGWADALKNILFPPADTTAATALTAFLAELSVRLFAPVVMGHLLALIVPLLVILILASIYVADVYEQNIKVARRFISQAAFSFPKPRFIRAVEGRVHPEDLNSPVYLIGGPGGVRVYLENLAVFEKIDGEVEVIGPTINEPGNIHHLEGFERARSIIDLRDQVFRIDEIHARTIDGISIGSRNLRLLFSIMRGSGDRSLKKPYPYLDDAVHELVYGQEGGPIPEVVSTLVYHELLSFVGEHTLGELISPIGDPEIRQQIYLDSAIRKQIWETQKHSRRIRNIHPPLTMKGQPLVFKARKHKRALWQSYKFSRMLLKSAKAPDAVHRQGLRELFSKFHEEFVDEFAVRSRIPGVKLEWIDVGTWQIAGEIIPNQHIDAWKKTNENLIKSQPRVLDNLHNQTRVQEQARLVREVPLMAFASLRSQTEDHETVIYNLIEEYRALLQTTIESMIDEGKPVPERIQTALDHIHAYQVDFQVHSGRVRKI
ncbi:MAG: hypothetical protein HPY76_11380 [Anaerolineae bacterium]|nr:hypothetical protein [Anaerolineae bacterium]